MKILVTGGAGFIGSHVCETLLERGNLVVCVDNFNSYYDPKIKQKNISNIEKNPYFRVYKIDIANFEAIKTVFEVERPDKVIHLAASAGVRASIDDPFLFNQSNISGTLNLLELSSKFNVKKFIFGSSSSVYGERTDNGFKETDNVDNPISPYASTKRAGELLCRTYNHIYKIPIACLRFFNVYGPRVRPDMAPHRFISAMIENKVIEVYGDGLIMRDFTYVSDVVSGIILALDHKTLNFEIINLGNSNPVTLNEFINTIEKIAGKKFKIDYLSPRAGDVPKTCADITKAKAVLNWEPKLTLEEGLKITYKYFLNN